MLYCKVHKRLYAPSYGWMAYTPVRECRLLHGMTLIEGSCDRCVQEAKAQLKAQYPHLYALVPHS
jgi:hypothetical protein